MLQKMKETPSRSKCTVRDVPASYSPRSKRLPLNKEKTLWNHGSRLGNSTVEPRVTTSKCGSNILFFCASTACVGTTGVESAAAPMGASQTTVAGEADAVVSPSSATLPETVDSCAPLTPAASSQQAIASTQGHGFEFRIPVP